MAKQYFASDYAYGVNPAVPALEVATGFSDTGAQTAILVTGTTNFTDTYGQNTFSPLATNTPVLVGGGATQDSVTPSAVTSGPPPSFTATFTYAHGNGTLVASATVGLQEALNEASKVGGEVVVDGRWAQLGGTTSMITSAANGSGTHQCYIQDKRGAVPNFYFWTGSAWQAGAGDTSTGLFSIAKTLNSTTQSSSLRLVQSELTMGYAGNTTITGSVTAGRFAVTVGSTTHIIGTGSYEYGLQGKLIINGYINTTGGNGIIQCAVLAQLDLSNALGVSNTSQVTALWVDCGAAVGTVTDANIDVSTFYQNIAGLTANSVFRVLAKATYLFDLSSSSVFLTGTTGSNAYKNIAVNTTDGVKYIQLFSTST